MQRFAGGDSLMLGSLLSRLSSAMASIRSAQWFDERSLELARAAAEKIRCDRGLFAIAQRNLQRWRHSLNPWPDALREWEEILKQGEEAALAALIEESERGCRCVARAPSRAFSHLLS